MADSLTQNDEIFARNDEFDEDEDHANQPQQIVPKHHPKSSIDSKADDKQDNQTLMIAATNFKYDIDKIFKTDKDTYLYTSIPKDHLGFVPCRITRHKGVSTTFHMYFEGQNENDLTFLLTARKHLSLNGHSEYIIGIDENISKTLTDGNSVALLKGMNIIGSEYVLYDQRFCSTNPQNKEQLAAIVYNEHIFGSKDIRKLTVLLRDPEKTVEPTKEHEVLINQWRAGHTTDLIEIKNKTPEYNEESKKYILNFFENRVKLPSHKNFQLCTSPGENHEDNIIMQFGRIDDNNFALDYRYPLTAIQAFGIALSSFHNRFRP
ncbi:hypothetical protein I4U23_015713 [Adineta vaga]|nr:hypothetical protein I4U23_015713 [Adineta vaga]